ncbi:FBP domain-containing protein [Gordonia sp. VNK21]|uniref:FBP domain-containing protein n=1 Tax=Gordonia sp. VNK21 TaxID=3382483 RepID=UPI0038D394D4
MKHCTQPEILAAFRGATRSEVKRVTFRPDFDEVDFSRLDFYGWRDPKLARRSYIVVEHEGELVALILNRADARPSRKAMCAWCRDVDLTQDVVMVSVRRAGAKGRRGATVGTLVCEDFGCSRHVRKLPPAFHKGTDLDAIREEQVAGLRHRVDAFVAQILADD